MNEKDYINFITPLIKPGEQIYKEFRADPQKYYKFVAAADDLAAAIITRKDVELKNDIFDKVKKCVIYGKECPGYEFAPRNKDHIDEITPRSCNVLHLSAALMGEVVEMHFAPNLDNYREEMGDVTFYATAICGDDVYTSLMYLTRYTALDLSVQVYLNRNNSACGVFTRALMHLMYPHNSGIAEEIRQLNYEKLSKRYPNAKYSDEDAKTRKDISAGPLKSR